MANKKANWLKAERHRLHLTRRELAAITGYTEGIIYKWENDAVMRDAVREFVERKLNPTAAPESPAEKVATPK